MNLSGKTIINNDQAPKKVGMITDFDKSEFIASIQTKGNTVIYEKAYICPCKNREIPDHLTVCRNCGGKGWIFANPTRTKMLIVGIRLEDKLKDGSLREWGMADIGFVQVTAPDDYKLTYMDRITNIDATAENHEILYPQLNDYEDEYFAFTKYPIKSFDYVAMFVGSDSPLQRLTQGTHYTFQDNVIRFIGNDWANTNVTVRYVHNPAYHVIDIMRESMTSYNRNGLEKLVLPINVLARRAHLVFDPENLSGDRLIDNSWLPGCV